LNGVTKAVNDPRNLVLAAIDFLQARWALCPFCDINSYRVRRSRERPSLTYLDAHFDAHSFASPGARGIASGHDINFPAAILPLS
jgi:hypothetical protein